MLSVAITKKLKAFFLDVSFEIGKEVVVLFGPSGAGKTTILNCISGITQPDYGFIQLNQQMLFETKKKPLPIQERNIGYLFQNYALFPHMTIKKNITYEMKDEAFVYSLIDAVGIKHLLDSYPRNISGGEKQRVALVRALAAKPNALLLDEPFSSLDTATKMECQSELLRIHAEWKIPIILVTHDYDEAKKLGNRIIRLESGKLAG